MKCIIRKIVAVSLLVISSNAWSFFDPPLIVPTQPVSDFPVSVRMRSGVCDTYATTGPLDREVEIIGNRVLVRAVGISTDDDAQCIFPVGNFTYTIGLLPAGSYHAEVYVRQLLFPSQLTLVGKTAFTVEQRPVVAIPATGAIALALMALGLCVISASVLRRSTI